MSDSAQHNPRLLRRQLLVKRTVVSSTLGLVTGVAAHVMMGGDIPGPLGIAPAWVAATLLGLVMLRTGRVGLIVAHTLGSQYLFHVLAVLGSGPREVGHIHAHSTVIAQVDAGSASMTFGHLLAALVTAFAVWQAHRVRTLLREIRRVLQSLWSFDLPAVPSTFVERALVRLSTAPARPGAVTPMTGGAFALRAPPTRPAF